MDMVVPLVERSISAYSLQFELADLIRRIDRLQLAQQRGRPPVKPEWWDDHLTDPEWPGRHGRYVAGCREDRLAYLHWKALAAAHAIRDRFHGLFNGIDAAPRERSILQEAYTAVKVIYDILKAPKLHPRLYWAVVPEPDQLNRTLPCLESPVLPSAHERWLHLREDEIHYQYVQGHIDRPTAEHLVGVIHERLRVLGVQRIAENLRLIRSMANLRRNPRAVEILNGWRTTVRKWKLAEDALRRADRMLRGDWNPGEDAPHLPAVRVQSVDEHVLREAVRLMRASTAKPRSELQAGAAPDPKVSWRQPALDTELWKLVHTREADIANLERRLRSADPDVQAAARRDATARWGARSLKKQLRVRAHAMITKSPAWRELANRLGLGSKSRRGKRKRIGTEAVLDSIAQATEAAPDSVVAAPDLEDQLNLAIGGLDQATAEALRQQLIRKETTPERVMEIIATLRDDGAT